MNSSARTRPTWSRVTEIPAVCLDRRNLGQCLGAAALVGTILFLINQADVVFGGQATAATWAKIGLSYLVPFFVSNYGIVAGSRRT
ncbi:MAG: nitrate/nitrite transporter NrtS [bacterium]